MAKQMPTLRSLSRDEACAPSIEEEGRLKVAKRLIFGTFSIWLVGIPASQSLAESPPAQLQGKSVIVTWTEKRVQRPLDEEKVRTVTVSVGLDLYVSDQGRIFSRMRRQIESHNSAKRDRLPGESLTGHAGETRFEGRVLIIDSTYASGARRIAVAFDAGYGGCTASIIQGKEGGAQKMIMTSMINKKKLEVHSIEVLAPRCSVRQGNVFAP
jgi:hypothetical protein